LDIPILVDLPGPLVMEYYWRDNDNYFQHIVDKIECLAKADYYICALDRQQGYYQAWLTWAGVTPDENRITTVPFCFPEMPFSRQGHVEDEPLFFWGGLFWPWQERMTAFRWIAETLQQVRQGQLVVLGGGDRDEDVRGEFRQFLNHPHISWLGNFCFAEYVCELKRSSVAVDLCQATAERTLSSDLRTGVSLWAGTPCIVTESSPWASLIEEHNAGWVVPYEDEKKIKTLIKEIALDRVDLVAKRRGARDISTKISQPLSNPVFLSWFKDLSKRPKSPTFLTARGHDREQRLKSMQQELDRTRFELDTVKHDLHAIRARKLFQLYKKLQGLLGK
jgi:glycosyltransferase involved in cell wall biosynthesis